LNPAARIVVVGCSTASEKEKLSRIPQVAFLAGNEEKDMVASFLNGGWRPGEPFPARDRDIFRLRISRYADRTRANIKVQDGCDSFCSFCIIPFLRGRSRSRHPDAVVEEVRRLVENGYREIVVTGVHLQHYGSDLGPGEGLAGSPTTLPGLLRRVASVAGGARIRMSSIGVCSFTPELIDVLSGPPFCPHWHIPLQSGSDAVLERMRRDYRMDDFRRVVADLGARFEHPSITTDIIVGHPGESEADFERTLDVAREIGFSKIHVFPFSPREGTLATKLGGHIDPLEVRRRARVLRDLEQTLARAYRERFVGRTVEVLVEGLSAEGEDLDGYTDRYLRVRFPAPSPGAARRFAGTLQPVLVTAGGATAAAGAWAGKVETEEALAT
jgi:threonylcarbamoyladenosine tRNA methylthiotransferase MtaB